MVTLMSNPWPSPAEYEFLRQLVYEHSRISLGADKKDAVSRRLQLRLKSIGLAGYQEYCDLLKSSEGSNELAYMLDAVLTDAAVFFNEKQHFKFLATDALPQWLKAQDRHAGDVFRVWSAGCGSGEEPYSAAIVLADFFSRHSKFHGEVIASDICVRALERAREGIYRLEQVELPEVEWLKRYFLKGVGAYQGSCRVKEDIKKMVTFRHANLFQPESPTAESGDVIFCRNLMSCVDQESQEELVQLLSAKLHPGGYLFLSHSERLPKVPHAFSAISPGVYRETASSLAFA
jgi:chemotaxis protein methyltransferase CheR